jgi:hypothetical protein
MTDGADINGPGILFLDLERAAGNQCVFETKLNAANAGLSGAYRQLWTKVPHVQNEIYQSDPPPSQTNWFTELMSFTFDPGITSSYKAIQDKYHPTREYALHPALHSGFYLPDSEYGTPRGSVRKGLRDPYYRPILDLDVTVPPFINLYKHYKIVSSRIKGESLVASPTDKTDLSELYETTERLIPQSIKNLPVI